MGDFHTQGNPSSPIIRAVEASKATLCLVGSNQKKQRGTIHWYGIDGVCHQLSNQVLYATATPNGGKPKVVSEARGYKLSSALFGTYGRREGEWKEARTKCGVAPITVISRKGSASLLSRRLSYALVTGLIDDRVVDLELARRQLLAELDDIGFAIRSPRETVEDRVSSLNERINSFLQFAASYLTEDSVFMRVFGVRAGEWVELIDYRVFEFPETSDKPVRNMLNGW